MQRELPEGWEWKRLDECCQIIRGISFPSNSKTDHFQEDFVACLRTANVQEEVEVDDLWFIPEQFVKNEKQFVKKFDILISSANSLNLVGKVALVKKLEYKTTLGAFISLLRSNSTIDPKYLHYYLSSNVFKRFIPFIASTTTNISNISMTKLAAFQLAVPPLPVQRQIVAVLEHAEAVKRQRQEADALTGTLLQSGFYKIFGDPVRNEQRWDFAQLDELCSVITDGEHVTPRRTKSGIFLLSARNIQNHYISTTDVDFIDEEEYTRLSKHIIPQNGDVLVSCSGTVGRVTRVNVDYKFQLVRSVAIMRPIVEKVDPIYLEYSFDTQFMKDQISKCVHQSSQANLFQGMIRKLKIPLPPLAIQQQFARVVQDVERIREQQVSSGLEIEGLCEGLMQRAFAGELVAE